jgi:adenosylhomocysteine nucleosidase
VDRRWAQSDVLVVFAMREEAQGLFDAAGAEVLYTGVGKVNSAWALTRRLHSAPRPQLVLDFGTVGSPRFPVHALVECVRFVQRDMDATPLGIPLGTTPFDTLPAVLEVPRRFPQLPAATCGSADRFEMASAVHDADVVEMEAYALAKVCQHEQVDFMAIKYVTDGADHTAHVDWAANLPRAAAAFFAIYQQLLR